MKVTLCDGCGASMNEEIDLSFYNHWYSISEYRFSECQEKKIDLCRECIRELYVWLRAFKEDAK